MPIDTLHPIVRALDNSRWTFHLIGSRYVGKFSREHSDYDFLAEVEGKDHDEFFQFLRAEGFVPDASNSPTGYGPDQRLRGSCVWMWKGEGLPGVDVLAASPEEVALRMRWFRAMRAVGDESGLIAMGMKNTRAWPLLWKVLAKFEESA